MCVRLQNNTKGMFDNVIMLMNVVVLLALIDVDAAPSQSAKSGFNFDNTSSARSQLRALERGCCD